MESFFGVVPDWLAGPLLVAFFTGLGGWMTTIYRCVHKQSKRGWRQSQAIMLIAEHIQEETRRLHHNDKNAPDLGKKVERILKDEHGQF